MQFHNIVNEFCHICIYVHSRKYKLENILELLIFFYFILPSYENNIFKIDNRTRAKFTKNRELSNQNALKWVLHFMTLVITVAYHKIAQ